MDNFATATVEGFVAFYDEKVITTKTDKKIFNFTLIVEHRPGEGMPPQTSYIDIEAWEKLAEIAYERIREKMPLMVIGRLTQERWEDKHGEPCQRIKIIAHDIRLKK